MLKAKWILLLFFLVFLDPIVIFALSSDNQLPLLINSASFEDNEKTGVGLYLRDVKLTQGTTHLTGDKMNTYHAKHVKGFQKIIAYGTPKVQAKYWTLVDDKHGMFYAQADVITYYPDQRLAVFTQHVHATNQENTYTGSHIEYDMINGIVTSKPDNNQTSTIVMHTVTHH